MEDGELDVEEGEVAVETNLQVHGSSSLSNCWSQQFACTLLDWQGSLLLFLQSARPPVPLPPDSPDYDGALPQRKPKKAKLAKAVAAGYIDVYGTQVSCSLVRASF